MTTKRVATIKLQGKDYAQVKDRVNAFRSDHPEADTETSYAFHGDIVIFKASVAIPNKGKSTGHSFGKTAGVKAFEKLETIAMGRALAFLGYMSDGGIASKEEMEKYEEGGVHVDNFDAIQRLGEAKSLDEVKKVWQSLSQAERNDNEVEHVKNEMKKKYENSPSRTEVGGVAPVAQG